MTDKLKLCPFCGGEAVYMDINTEPIRYNPTIECVDCGCKMVEISKDFLIDCWNRRADDEQSN
jgi:Lar family restriction alleviation protein